jgi:hypothetical protein
MLIPVFAAQIENPEEVRLTWEHSEGRWCTADECKQRLSFRGLQEGLERTRLYITENATSRSEFRLA